MKQALNHVGYEPTNRPTGNYYNC